MGGRADVNALMNSADGEAMIPVGFKPFARASRDLLQVLGDAQPPAASTISYSLPDFRAVTFMGRNHQASMFRAVDRESGRDVLISVAFEPIADADRDLLQRELA